MAILNTSMDPNPQVKLPDSGHDSVRSTKSLSIFVNPDTPKEMARSEEVTMDMYADSPDHVSPTAASGRSKRRHRDTTEHKLTKDKENRKTETTSSTSKTGFFKLFKKKKQQESKSNDSAVTTVEVTSTSMHIGRKEGVTITDVENSFNHRTELENSRTDAEASAASTQGEQVISCLLYTSPSPRD